MEYKKADGTPVYAERIVSAFGNDKDGYHGFLANGLKFELPKEITPPPHDGDYLVAVGGKTIYTVSPKKTFEAEFGVR